MDAPSYVTDLSRWPLVRIQVPAENPDMAGFERHLVNLRGLLDRRRSYVIVFDARFGGSLPADQRERLRAFRRVNFFEAQRYQRAMAFVVSDGFQRAVLGAITWLAPAPCPTRTFSSVAEAEEWGSSRLARERAD